MSDGAKQTVVLLVEDEAVRPSPCRTLVEAIGATCCTVHSLKAADTMLQQAAPDVLIVDYNLRDGTGLDLINQVRQSPQHRNTPIILLTGEIHPNELERAVMMGIYAFLSRPFSSPEFTKLVNAAIAEELGRVRNDRP